MNGEDPVTIDKSGAPAASKFSWLAGLTVAGGAKAVLWILVVSLVVFNYFPISDGLGGLAKRLPDIARVSVGAVSMEMGAGHIEEKISTSTLYAISDRERWGPNQAKNAADGLKGLDKRTLIRLMKVGLLANVCRYPNPKAEMLFDYADDESLSENKLVDITPSSKIMRDVQTIIREQEKKAGKPFELGQPTECYELTLTGKGQDVRSWLTHWLSSEFNPNDAKSGAGK